MHPLRPHVNCDNEIDGQNVMLFDGVCGFCSASVRFVAGRSRRDALSFCPMQSRRGEVVLRKLGLPLAEYETMALVKGGRISVKSEAVLQIAGLMNSPWPLFAALVRWIPKAILDRFYDLVARNRYRIAGRKAQCMVPGPDLANRFLR